MSPYVQRTLSYEDAQTVRHSIADTEVAGLAEPLIVLGEPGMGKSTLLQAIAAQHRWPYVSASFFVNNPTPAQLVKVGGRIVIDGLDELAAQQEADPLNRVLGRLNEAGFPAFVLSCRAADWRSGAAKRDVPTGYGRSPLELTLEPFTRLEATLYLATTLGPERAAEVVRYLEDRGIPDLYGNPLTLGLLAEVAAHDGELPASRAELLRRAISLLWCEHNEVHDRTPLANLDEETALLAAGAACAATILTGAEAIATKPGPETRGNVLKLAEVQALPGGAQVRAVLASRLFVAAPGRSDWFKPIHRMVAEYLGASWLVANARDELARARVRSILTSDGGVPASLRGIHAWLAQDVAFAPHVIALDPYGVLRYGDADGLGPVQGSILLNALKTLQEEDPYFRAEDWTQHPAKGLARREIQPELCELLLAPETRFHLRTLLLGAIRGSELEHAARAVVREIMLGGVGRSFGYAERYDAFEVVLAWGEDDADWLTVVEELIAQRRSDSARLAFNVMAEVGFERFSAQHIGQFVHACSARELDPDVDDDDDHTQFYVLARQLPQEQIVPVLDYLAANADTLELPEHSDALDELVGLRNHLLGRTLAVRAPAATQLLAWFRIAQGHWSWRDREGPIAAFLAANVVLRQEMQWLAYFQEGGGAEAEKAIWNLEDSLPGLRLDPDDLIAHLQRIARVESPEPTCEQLWRAFARIGRMYVDRAAEILAAARPFAGIDSERVAFLDDLARPREVSEWELERHRQRREREKEDAGVLAARRELWAANVDDLRAGDLRWTYDVAKVYLGHVAKEHQSLMAPDRVSQVFGLDLAPLAMEGLAAVLSRAGLPQARSVSESYAQGQRWHFIWPMTAAVAERLRSERGLDDVDVDIIQAVRVALEHESYLPDHVAELNLKERLDESLLRRPEAFESYVRMLIEPQLAQRDRHTVGLDRFLNSTRDRTLATRLSVEWLSSFPSFSIGSEVELVRVLATNGHFAELEELRRSRDASGYFDEAQRRLWWGIGLFYEVPMSPDGAATLEMIWEVREWLDPRLWTRHPQPERRIELAAWAIRTFRDDWPMTEFPRGGWSGDTNPWDASRYLSDLIHQLSGDPSEAALIALDGLAAGTVDLYTPALRHAARLQRQATRESSFTGVNLKALRQVVSAQAPATADDLLVVLQHGLRRLQAELRGSATDPVNKYWCDDGSPRNEDYCTDRLAEDLERFIPASYGITWETQADMPRGKRVDLLYSVNGIGLPLEAKGQWHKDLWLASEDQLESLYLEDARTRERGLYLVYWFGHDVPRSEPRSMPDGTPAPATAEELRDALTAKLPPEKRGRLVVEVLDFTFPR